MATLEEQWEGGLAGPASCEGRPVVTATSRHAR